jgi:hypothetical protein
MRQHINWRIVDAVVAVTAEVTEDVVVTVTTTAEVTATMTAAVIVTMTAEVTVTTTTTTTKDGTMIAIATGTEGAGRAFQVGPDATMRVMSRNMLAVARSEYNTCARLTKGGH